MREHSERAPRLARLCCGAVPGQRRCPGAGAGTGIAAAPALPPSVAGASGGPMAAGPRSCGVTRQPNAARTAESGSATIPLHSQRAGLRALHGLRAAGAHPGGKSKAR